MLARAVHSEARPEITVRMCGPAEKVSLSPAHHRVRAAAPRHFVTMDGNAPPPRSAVPLLVSVGIEGTFEPVSGKDTLVATGHFSGRRWSEDLALVRGLGLAEVRY